MKHNPNIVTNSDLVIEISDAASNILARQTFFQRRNNSTIQFISSALLVLTALAPAVGFNLWLSVGLGVIIAILSTLSQAFTKGALTPSAVNDIIAETATKVEPDTTSSSPFKDYYKS